ncbi:hypothetical protein OIV83_005138 [Microbotryomycetes sp. JL201]|nr:hypothetical protein OIV83_005138 [Microbotryomycetes sp. JL201]
MGGHARSRALSSLDASFEPLAGTTAGSSIPWLFIAQLALGLPTILWTYKCAVLVMFQRKIMYLPYVPLGSRKQTLDELSQSPHASTELAKLVCHQIATPSPAPTRWLRRPVELQGLRVAHEALGDREPQAVIVYLQGNAGTPLLRLPLFRRLLLNAQKEQGLGHGSKSVILAFAPRSYWLSTRATPTETSILEDYSAAIKYARDRYPNAHITLYGHSLGGAAAIRLVLSRVDIKHSVGSLIIENPLPSIPYMVRALYPQKWLPYHYLGGFAFDRWDARGELAAYNNSDLPPALWIRSGKDEIIPTWNGDPVLSMFKDWQRCSRPADASAWLDIPDALHDTAFLSRSWNDRLAHFLNIVSSQDRRTE